jgi:alkanesulfonate monooxygenase SsuD/methylene tetrahydromethanopterin reductase-like flavin-dependent oxidoreductase (luciferase family)
LIPIGVNPTAIGVTSRWWLESAQAFESAGFAGVWCWDHFISQGRDKSVPVLECWTTLAATAALTTRIRLGSFVTNVMNRHPAVLARMLATISDQSGARVDLGIGVGGNEAELSAYGIPFPPAEERIGRLEEAVDVLRLLWRGGPADYDGRYFQLREAYASPAPAPPPRIIIGGQTPAGARLAARIGDGWTCNGADYERLLPIHLAELEAAGRRREEVRHLVAVRLERAALEAQPLVADMVGYAAEWAARGADELIVNWVRNHEIRALVDAANRAGLAPATQQ